MKQQEGHIERGNERVDVLVIIQARMCSLRLPNKILADLDGKSLIQHTIERAQAAKGVSKVILATSTNPENDPLELLCKKLGIFCFRGSEEDVLDRFVHAINLFVPRLVVRICGDEPLLDPRILEETITQHERSGADYTTTVNNVPRGLDVEVFSGELLARVATLAKDTFFREHVTAYILRHPTEFKIHRADFDKALARTDIVLTVDTKYDLLFIKQIYNALKIRNVAMHDTAVSIVDIVDTGEAKRTTPLLFRADASREQGMGDVGGLLNIADVLAKDHECFFAAKANPDAVAMIKQRGYETIELSGTEADELETLRGYCNERKIAHAVVNFVPARPDYVRSMSSFTIVAMIDYFGNIPACADVIIYPDIFPETITYAPERHDVLILKGPAYIPVRAGLPYREQQGALENITVVYGGSDAQGFTLPTLNVVQPLENDYQFTFILGPGNRDVTAFVAAAAKHDVTWVPAPNNLQEIFQKSDLVITAGGLTCFELCAMGIPFVGISDISWEKRRLQRLAEEGACIYLAPKELPLLPEKIQVVASPEQRMSLVRQAHQLVDGQGAKRIASTLKERWHL